MFAFIVCQYCRPILDGVTTVQIKKQDRATTRSGIEVLIFPTVVVYLFDTW